MACLNLSNGDFVAIAWSDLPSTNVGDVTIARTATNISIQKVGFPGTLNLAGDFRYAVYGDLKYIALLHISTGPEPIDRRVSIVDITGTTLTTREVHVQGLVNHSVSLPNIAHSQGNGSLTFVWSSTGTVNEVNTLSIVRSDNGHPVLTALGPKSGINGTIRAEVTATNLIIHHPVTIGADSTTAPRPAGSLQVNPLSQNFGEAVLGAADPALATITRTFTLRNNGNDCITITAITDNAPFSLTPASAALFPLELDPEEEQDIDIVFAPGTTGNFIRDLNITRTPANGDGFLTCQGSARQAVAQIATSVGAIDFGTIPHPGTATRTFTVSNTGEVDVNITILGPPPGSDFTWTAVTGQSLPVGAPPFPVSVTFTTPGDLTATPRIITVTPTQGNPRTVTLTGAGCRANATIQVPPTGPLDFGEIEQGFRTVRFIEISNLGDGELTFRARITPDANPAHAGLFGLVIPDHDITDAPPSLNYTVLPTQRCGPGAVGENRVVVAVSFFADDAPAPAPYSANLVIEQHNADNFPPGQTWTFPLSAVIIPPIPVDAVLVIDRSGSMGDIIGTRQKSEAALSASRLFVQMLRDSAADRAAIIRYNHTPEVIQSMLPVRGNRTVFENALTPANFTPNGWTNIAGGIIVGETAYTPNPANPPVLKKAMIVLTDGKENRCFQIGGAGPWFSITGRDANGDASVMARPDGTPQDTEVLPTPADIKVYGIGLGNPAQIDGAALDALSTATGASYDGVVELTGRDFFLLEKYFTQIFMDTAGLATIADPFFTITAGEVHEYEFDIFPGDVNAMIVIYDEPGRRLPFHIISPKGEVLSGTSLPPGFNLRYRSTNTARFVEFFFPKKEPERYVGRWKVSVRHEKYICSGNINPPRQSKQEGKCGPGFTPPDCKEDDKPVNYGIAIGAGSNLRLQPYVEPGVKYVGDTIRLSAVLSEAGLPVKGANVRVTVEDPAGAHFNVVLRDDGLSQDGEADDGEYGGVFTQTFAAGVYKLHFRAEGHQARRPYVREAHRTKSVYDRRKPPDVGDPGGGQPDSCCKRRLRLLHRIEALLHRLLQQHGKDK